MNKLVATAVWLMISGMAFAQTPVDQKQERIWKVFMGLEAGGVTGSDDCTSDPSLWAFHLGIQRRAFGLELGIDDFGTSTRDCSNTKIKFSPNALSLVAFGEKTFGGLSLIGKVGMAQIETDLVATNPNYPQGTENRFSDDTSSTLVGGGLGVALSRRFALTFSGTHYFKDPRDEDNGMTTFRGGIKFVLN